MKLGGKMKKGSLVKFWLLINSPGYLPLIYRTLAKNKLAIFRRLLSLITLEEIGCDDLWLEEIVSVKL